MAKKSEVLSENGSGRRDFLKMSALVAPAAMAATASVGVADAEAAIDSGSEKIRDTAHTRAYYDSARF